MSEQRPVSAMGPDAVAFDPRTRRVTGRATKARLAWCATHAEPGWLYDDGSFGCPHDLVVESNTTHEVVDPPWEAPPVAAVRADQQGPTDDRRAALRRWIDRMTASGYDDATRFSLGCSGEADSIVTIADIRWLAAAPSGADQQGPGRWTAKVTPRGIGGALTRLTLTAPDGLTFDITLNDTEAEPLAAQINGAPLLATAAPSTPGAPEAPECVRCGRLVERRMLGDAYSRGVDTWMWAHRDGADHGHAAAVDAERFPPVAPPPAVQGAPGPDATALRELSWLLNNTRLAVTLLRNLVDDEPCTLDHHGSCQTHHAGRVDDGKGPRCSVAVAVDLIAGAPSTDPAPEPPTCSNCGTPIIEGQPHRPANLGVCYSDKPAPPVPEDGEA